MRNYLLPAFLFVLDTLTLIVAGFLSFYLRFDSLDQNQYFLHLLYSMPLFIFLYLACFTGFRLYKRAWRYAGVRELLAIWAAATCGGMLFFIINSFTADALPRSMYIISYLLIIGIVGADRFCLYCLIIIANRRVRKEEGQPVLIIGAGDAGAMIAREIVRYHPQGRRLVGFVDDDPKKQGQLLNGCKIFGTRALIPELVSQYDIRELIIAMPSAGAAVISDIVEYCSTLQCKITTLPGIYQLLDNMVSVSYLRPVDIEDLLQRDPVQLDDALVRQYVQGRSVLISGAGGSIGSELCRQVIQMHPRQLILLGHGENSIYTIYQELLYRYGGDLLIPVIVDVRDKPQLAKVFAEYRPEVVFHAAAHKHVPLMERQPMAAILNNVYGTRNMAETAGMYGAERFVMISTDKAVNPTSVMGASKRVAEKVVQVMNSLYETKYITVRFGNVLGSRGSVIPLFRKQLAVGGPLTVTHPEMTRYFMTIPEASQLVLQAGALGNGGEVFLLDMGQPVKIMDLAKNMIRLSGLEPGKDVKIRITGLRPGEKLYEELLTAAEGTQRTTHKKIFAAPLEPVNGDLLMMKIDSFEQAQHPEDVIRILEEILPTYHPNHKPDNSFLEHLLQKNTQRNEAAAQ